MGQRAQQGHRALRRHWPGLTPFLASNTDEPLVVGRTLTVHDQDRPGAERLDLGFVAQISSQPGPAQPVSVLIDKIPYYDPRRQSRLDRLLDNRQWATDECLQTAEEVLAFKSGAGLSRFNSDLTDLVPRSGQETILVIGREADDCWTGPATGPYAAMLEAARADHPAAHIVWVGAPVPGVEIDLADQVIAAALNRVQAVQAADRVYSAGGLTGLEAVIVGTPVVCFGTPFYAGLGLTEDRFEDVKPRSPVSALELFAAAYLIYPDYVDPFSGTPCSPRLAFERLAGFRSHARRVQGHWVGLNIPAPKRAVIRAFLEGPLSTVSFGGGKRPGALDHQLAWVSRPNTAVREARQRSPTRMVNVEDGFLRSIGLGSSFQPAASLVFDRQGIYYDPTVPSELETLLMMVDFDTKTLAEAARLRAFLVRARLSKYNLGGDASLWPTPPEGQRVLLVPGQVEGDASVLQGGYGLTNLGLLEQVRAAHPEAYIVYKEHPDVTAGNRKGRIPEALVQTLSDFALFGGDILQAIEAADEVHTLTSLSGFEALLRGKPVTTYGWPFYAGWGLTTDQTPHSRPRRSISLEALVAGTLIAYPLYLDPKSWLPCSALAFVERLEQLRDMARQAGQRPTTDGPLRRIAKGVRYALWPPRPPQY